MLNLHAPFRWAVEGDRTAVHDLLGGSAGSIIVVAEESGSIVAALSARPSGETLHVEGVGVTRERTADLGPRLLAVADAIAADEGAASVALRPETVSADLRDLLDQEGFRAAPDESGLLLRKVIPQG